MRDDVTLRKVRPPNGGYARVKVLLVHMCLCLVGTYESMFSCMNMSLFLLVCVCIYWVGTYEFMFSFKNMSVFCGWYM